MAAYRAAIFGTECDENNCAFYLKVGACRHGDECQKFHIKPIFSQTVLLKNFYLNPSHRYSIDNEVLYNYNFVSREEVQEHFDNFYEDVFVECERKYGYIICMNVCDNINDHLNGNVYIKFINEKAAKSAVNSLNNRWFGGKPIYAELSPVTDFNKAFCHQNKYGNCPKGPFCNFIHVKRPSPETEEYLFGKTSKRHHAIDKQRKSPKQTFTDNLDHTRISSKLNDRTSRNSKRRKSRSLTPYT